MNMDWTSWISVLVMLIYKLLYVAGEQQEIQIEFDIWEGNVTVLWVPPAGAPQNALYQVQQFNFSEWHIVPHCNMSEETSCNLGNHIDQPLGKARVGLLNGNDSFIWSDIRRIRLFESKLLAPDFNLSSINKMLKVKIFRKQFLEKLFDFGPRYTVTLQVKGDVIRQIEDEDGDGEVEFSSLESWQEYCVSVTVDMVSGNVQNTSLPRCIYLSADMSLVISIVTLSVVGTVSFFMLAVCFFLRRPGKMPAVLKSAVIEWHPMNIGLIHVEMVTDKGWLLTSNKMTEETTMSEEKTLYPEEDKERRESTDSGVSIGQQHSTKVGETDTHLGDDDSGCGSLTGPEDGGRRSVEELPSLDGEVSSGESREDSGLGMGNRDVSDGLNREDSGLLSEIVVVGDGYRSQSPSGDEQGEITVPCDVDCNLSGGYRTGHVTCLCSDFETCMWCKTRKLLRTNCDSVSHEQTTCTFTEDGNDRPSYLKKSLMQSANALGDLAPQLDENFESSSLLISFPSFLQQGQNLQCQLDTLPLTLGDVELTCT